MIANPIGYPTGNPIYNPNRGANRGRIPRIGPSRPDPMDLLLTFANADTRGRAVSSAHPDPLASDTAPVAAGLRDAGEERSSRWVG